MMVRMPFEVKVSPEKAAVIVVDMQNDYCHPDGCLGKGGAALELTERMTPTLVRFVDAARAAGVPVIFIQTIHTDETDTVAWLERSDHSKGICRKDTFGADFYGVAPLPGEIIVNKHRYSAFIGTRLSQVLTALKRETIIMTGVSTNVCVESTARDGNMLDYHVAFVADCCAATTQAAHDATLENIREHFGVVCTADEVIAAWKMAPVLAA